MEQLNQKEIRDLKVAVWKIFNENRDGHAIVEELKFGKVLIPIFAAAYWCKKFEQDFEDALERKPFSKFSEKAVEVDAIVHNLQVETRLLLLRLIKENRNIVFDFIKAVKDEILFRAIFTDEFADDGRTFSDINTSEGVSRLGAKLLAIQQGDIVMDMCSGTNCFLLNAAESLGNTKGTVSFKGVELSEDALVIANIRTVMAGVSIENIQGDVLTQDFSYIGANKIFTEFPYKYRNWTRTYELTAGLQKYFMDAKRTITSDWIFIRAALLNLKAGGRSVAIVLNSGLSTEADKDIRQALVDSGQVEAVIRLPEKIKLNLPISLSMLVLSEGNRSVKMLDASALYTKGRRQNYLQDKDIEAILSAYNKDTKEISRTVGIDELREQDYILMPSRYIKMPVSEDILKNSFELGSVCEIKRGAVVPAAELDRLASVDRTPYRYISPKDIVGNSMNKNLTYLRDLPQRVGKFQVSNNDIVMSKISPFKVAVATVGEDEKVIANGNLYFISVNESLANPIYLMLYLRSDEGMSQLNNLAKGVVMQTISIKDLQQVRIPKASLEKQNKIAKKYLELQDQLAVIERQKDLINEEMDKLVQGVF